MGKMLFEGIYSAIFSVYDENLDVKKDSVAKLVEYQLDGGVNGFYVGGNTGECTILPAKTRKQMLETVISANAGRGQIMAHIGAGHFDEVMDLLEHANSQKIDAISSLPPSLQQYFDQEETIEYYKILAKKSKFPVYAYIKNVNFDVVNFAKELSEIDNVAGIKMTVPNYYAMEQIKQIKGGQLNILNGPDESLLCGLCVGADGAIGTTYNIMPKTAVKIYNNFKSGNIAEALKEQHNLNNKLINIAFGKNIAYWKAVMTTIGFDMGHTEKPAKLCSEEVINDLKNKLDALGFYGEL